MRIVLFAGGAERIAGDGAYAGESRQSSRCSRMLRALQGENLDRCHAAMRALGGFRSGLGHGDPACPSVSRRAEAAESLATLGYGAGRSG